MLFEWFVSPKFETGDATKAFRFVETVTTVLLSEVHVFVLRALPYVGGLVGGAFGINAAATVCFPRFLKNPMVHSVLSSILRFLVTIITPLIHV
jgi:hypothetical protein